MDTEYDDDPFCRFCLRQSQSSFPIFMAADPDLAYDVMNCLQIKISPDCVGPKHICNECYDRVQDWLTFKRQSEEALKEIESNSNTNYVINEHIAQMDLIDEVDYHCCMHCDNIFPTEYELEAHVNEIHTKPADFDQKIDESMQFDQSALVDLMDSVHTDDYLNSLLNNAAQKITYEEFNETPHLDDEEEKFSCYYCNATFDKFVQLRGHSASKHRDMTKKTECNTCNKIFLTVSDLQKHVRNTHPTKSIKQQEHLEPSNMLKIPKKSPYICHLCNKNFSRFCDLLDHDEIQHDDLPKRFRCGVCSKLFLMEDRAKVHYNFYHTKTKGTVNYQCSFCGMELKSASAVANHERMHMTQKSTQFGYKIIRD